MNNLYINKTTKVIRKWHDLGGSWIKQVQYYGEIEEILSDEDFKKEWKIFNALETNNKQ